MKVLLINNASKSTENIKRLLQDFEILEVNYDEIPTETSDFDFAILSGGTFKPAFYEEEVYETELKFIRNSDIPIFGICLGMQLISQAFSPNKLTQLPEKRKGNIIIKINEDLFGKKELYVNEGHKWAVSKTSESLISLGESNEGIEIIKHETKNIWGVQFHPQADPDEGTEGKLIFDYFLKNI